MSEAQKDKFLDDYFQHEGIKLDPANIAYNKGLRDTMKIILNSLWGKFGQRGNRVQSRICLKAKDFYSIVLNDQLQVVDLFVCPSNQKVIELLYTEKESTSLQPRNSNTYIAAFTTCLARIRLYGLLDELGTSVLYYDTDSVVYRRLNSDPPCSMIGMFVVPSGDVLIFYLFSL